jgi:hypothetical protein
MHFPSTK